MTFYKVVFEHQSRRSKVQHYKHIESVDVHVEAESVDDAITQARQIFLYEHEAWKVRVIAIESRDPGPLEP